MKNVTAITALTIATLAGSSQAQTVYSGSAWNAEGLQEVVDAYRDALGGLNSPAPGSVCEGRREINWDGAPDNLAAPNLFPGDFFNQPNAPLARGAEFTTPGAGFQLSAKLESGEGIEYSNIDPSFDELFSTFSPQRLFVAIDSVITDVHFFVPGTDLPATSAGFGAVFSDVDVDGVTILEFYDVAGESLGVWAAPVGPIENESLSFLGVKFDDAIVAKVRITSGNAPLAWGQVESYPDVDLVVMDDFIYAEPVSLCPADCDANGALNILDFVCLKGKYDEGSACADINGDGLLNIQDFVYFQAAFQAGCQN